MGFILRYVRWGPPPPRAPSHPPPPTTPPAPLPLWTPNSSCTRLGVSIRTGRPPPPPLLQRCKTLIDLCNAVRPTASPPKFPQHRIAASLDQCTHQSRLPSRPCHFAAPHALVPLLSAPCSWAVINRPPPCCRMDWRTQHRQFCCWQSPPCWAAPASEANRLRRP